MQAAPWAVVQAAWTLPTLPEAPRSFVEGAARLLDRTKRTPGPVLVVAKSLGTLSAHWAAERGYPAVWLTPPLKAVGLHPMPTESRELAHRLRSYPEASLTVGGMADDLWSPGFRSTGQVLEIPGADHQLEDTDRHPSVRRHEEVAAAVAQFATGLLEE
ncbi:hypothetical protein [Nocardioides dubius]|uniref:hypothetical protein n=1 Tax=Nocardioides dubius TaxID=317019 RepID=UPI0039E83541